MRFSQISIKNYSVFQECKMDFGPGVNIFIGENGTGKTHIMKLLYSATQATNSRISFPYKIVRTMLPEEYRISRLLTRKQGASKASVRIYAKAEDSTEMKILAMSFHSKTKKWNADMQGEGTWQSAFQGESGIFIPAKEILSNGYNLNAAVEKDNIRFDDTYLDILNSAKVDISLGRNDIMRKGLLNEIEKIIDGKVFYDQKKDRFYLVKGSSKLEFDLVSEGIRKMALIWQLVKNEMIKKGTVLFWDEPEANMNPSFIPVIVDILLALSQRGIQIFVATHDYFLCKYLEARKTSTDSVVYHSLKKESEGLTYEKSEKFSLLEHNGILETARNLYREEVGVR